MANIIAVTLRNLVGKTESFKTNLRKFARQQLPEIVEEQGNVCYYCGKRIVDPAGLDPSQVEYTSEISVAWRPSPDSLLRYDHRATTDHVVPVSEFLPGEEEIANDRENLVASCWYCNQRQAGNDIS